MGKTIYFEGLGYRNPVADREQIIWFLQQTVSSMSKGNGTKYWLDLKERHEKRLLELEAFELYLVIKEKATDEKMKAREASRKKSKLKSQLEMDHFNEWYEAGKLRMELIKTIGQN